LHISITIGQVKSLSRFSSRIGGTMQPLWPARMTITTRNSMRERGMRMMRTRMGPAMGMKMGMCSVYRLGRMTGHDW